MLKFTAKVISTIFHPLFVPTLGVIYLMMMSPYRYGSYDFQQKSLLVIIIFIMTFIFPVFTLVILRLLKMIDSMQLKDRQQRTIPYVASASFYLWTYMMIRPNEDGAIEGDALIATMMLGVIIGVFLAFFMNAFTKVSIHAMAGGGMVGVVIFSAPFVSYNFAPFLFLAVFMAGLISSSRLILKAHSPAQVYLGLFIGFLGQFIPFQILSLL